MDNLIDVVLLLCFLALITATAYRFGYDKGIAHTIADMTITQNGEILTFNLDGGEWIYILERR